jgi:hypothetical protein
VSDDIAKKPEPVAPMGFVKGGTLSSGYEIQLAQQRLDAEKRRAAEDERKRIVRANPMEARMSEMRLGGHRDHAAVVLIVKHARDNTELDYIICELLLTGDGDLQLNMACPKCAQRGIADNFKISQKNRHFELDTRRHGEIWVNPLNPNEVVTLAGTINLTEWVFCPNLGCNWKFKIDNSILRME